MAYAVNLVENIYVRSQSILYVLSPQVNNIQNN